MALLSANIIVCETVLLEANDLLTAIRIMDTLRLAPGNNIARFIAITFLTCQPGDFSRHTLRIQATNVQGSLMAQTEDFGFVYGYKVDPSAPGGFNLRTEFAIDVSGLVAPTGCLLTAFLDGNSAARASLMLRR